MTMAKGTETTKADSREAANGDRAETVIKSGELLTIETIGDLSRSMHQAIMEAQAVVVEFPETVQVDITALQLFCSACRTATAAGKRFSLRGALPRALLDLAVMAGAERRENCKYNNAACFRKFGGKADE
jgi:ABC-type transporter Mla MlaB component